MARCIRNSDGRYHIVWPRSFSLPGQQPESSIGFEVIEGGQAVRLHYHNIHSKQAIAERIPVVTAQLRYGLRLFWACPGCSRRVGILYHQGNGFLSRYPGSFRCRSCHGLTYRSSQESDKRISNLVRQFEGNPEADTAAFYEMIAYGHMRTGLLLLKALDKIREREWRRLRALGIKIPPLFG
jgi:hypothetical protein